MSRSKKYPDELHALAYELHSKGLSHAEIKFELDKYCQRYLNRRGPSQRTVAQWSTDDDWAAQDEAAKLDLIEKAKARLVHEKQGILERLGKMADTTFQQYFEQITEGVRVPPSQAIYALIQLESLRHKLLKEGAQGPDIQKIMKAIAQPLINLFEQKVLRRPLSETEIEDLLAGLQEEIAKRGKAGK